MPVFPALPSLAGTVQIKVWYGNEITCNLAVVLTFQLKAVLSFPDCLVLSIIHVILKNCWKQVLKNSSSVT